VEDDRFLRGRGRYVDNIQEEGALEVAFVRSPYPSAHVEAIDTAEADRFPGVALVLYAERLPSTIQGLHGDYIHPTWQGTEILPLAGRHVRFVGEPVAAVAARDRYVAEDAAELVRVSYAPRPSVDGIDAALREDAPLVHETWKNNLYVQHGLSSGDVDGAFAEAAGRLRLRLTNHRQAAVPLEGRACLATWEAGALTFWSSTQAPQFARIGLARCLGIDEENVRVIAPDVGGGFGPKQQMIPEELAVAVLAAQLEASVRWTEDRRENLLTSLHSREQRHDLEVAYDADGRVLGLRTSIYVDCGAYSAYPSSAALDGELAMYALPGPYHLPALEVQVFSVATNKCPVGPYRGVGRPAACFSIERVMDAIAKSLHMDPVEVRRRNLIPADSFPYTTATGSVYDSGDFAACLTRLVEVTGYPGMGPAGRVPSAPNRRVGVGVACMVEQSSFVSAQRFLDRGIPLSFDHERVVVRLEPSGRVVVDLPTHSHGQGHETVVAQIVADELGVDLAAVDVMFGDTERNAFGLGTFNSRSAVVAGDGAMLAAREARGRLLEIAGAMLEADPADLRLAGGDIRVTGTDRRVGLFEAVQWHARAQGGGTDGSGDATIEGMHRFYGLEGTGTVSGGAHLAVVEVDVETGEVAILRYVVVEDCGRVINPLVVEGQVHGAVAQGIGGALMEEIVYQAGQLLTVTLADYLLPTAGEIPAIEVHHLETPSPLTALGVKGVGEGGTIAVGPAVAAAIDDALRDASTPSIEELPLVPERIWRVLGGTSLPTPLDQDH
jgi:carbon-monoxide dehydrogenase large subunit